MLVIVYTIFLGFLISLRHGVTSHELSVLDENGQTVQDGQAKDEMYELPSFTNYNKMVKTQVKPAGNTLTLRCKSHGIPPPNITWYKNNETPIERIGNIIHYGQWYVSLEDLIIDDSGTYTCVVCNIVGCINYNFQVTVVERYHNRPIITEPPENKTVVVGSNVSFNCTFLTDLNPHISWMAGSRENIEDNKIIQNSATSQNPAILILDNVTHESEGWYTCAVSNSLGNTFASAYLKIVDTLEEASQLQNIL